MDEISRSLRAVSVVCLAHFCAVSSVQAQDPEPAISNVVAEQRDGSYMVDIGYDFVAADNTYGIVTIEVSDDGGASYDVPVWSIAGDLGFIPAGTGKQIEWDAWTDWAGNYTEDARVRITVAGVPAPAVVRPRDDLAWIPPGSFNFGSSDGTPVQLTKGFWIGQFEVTQALFEEVMGVLPPSENADLSVGSLPVRISNYQEAADFCVALTNQEREANRLPDGWAYRLPTEAEWEFACRAGATGGYSFDESLLPRFAWYSQSSFPGGELSAQPVGRKAPTRWGLFDIHGNAWEACTRIRLTGEPLTDPKGEERYILCGGDVSLSRPEAYKRGNIGTTQFLAGFRIVLAEEETQQ